MDNKKKSLQDIFEDDDLGLLNKKPAVSYNKTEDQRLIESFEEINSFYENQEREPAMGSIAEMKLSSRLKALRENPIKKEKLKDFDRFHLLTSPKKIESLEDIFIDDLDILKTDETLSIFDLKNVPQHRAESDFVAQRKPLSDKEFKPYQELFKQVHADLKRGKRQLLPFQSSEKNLKSKSFYILDGILLFLEDADLTKEEVELQTGNRVRQDGRTRTVFENGTYSNMLFRSLGKQLLDNGKIVTHNIDTDERVLFENANLINDEDQETGWIYVLKSKSSNPKISGLKDLYKIGYSSFPVEERIKNAPKEATYLYADVQIIGIFKCYNLHVQRFENLLHRFFSEVCLNVEIYDKEGRRISPREWFQVPLPLIEKVIRLILNGEIINYKYNPILQLLEREKLPE